MIKIKVGDIVRVEDLHHFEPHYYEVSSIEQNCVISQPAHFKHWLNNITAIYRLMGKDFKCIWEKTDDKL